MDSPPVLSCEGSAPALSHPGAVQSTIQALTLPSNSNLSQPGSVKGNAQSLWLELVEPLRMRANKSQGFGGPPHQELGSNYASGPTCCCWPLALRCDGPAPRVVLGLSEVESIHPETCSAQLPPCQAGAFSWEAEGRAAFCSAHTVSSRVREFTSRFAAPLGMGRSHIQPRADSCLAPGLPAVLSLDLFRFLSRPPPPRS